MAAGDDQPNQFRDLNSQESEEVFMFTSTSEDEEEEGSFSDDDDHHRSEKAAATNEFSRICKVCKKGFSSGKALGGHSRIHAQPKKQSVLIKRPRNFNKQYYLTHLPPPPPGTPTTTTTTSGADCCNPNTCSVCGKSFPSDKSLFGHMRCHPDRNWRGIQPPLPLTTTTTAAANKNSSSSTLSEAEAIYIPGHKMDDQIDSATTTTTVVVDLAQSLPGWSSTARRGRKGTLSSSSCGVGSGLDEQIPEDVVHNLMMLAQGHHQDSLNSGRVDHVSNMMMPKKKKRRKLKFRDLDTVGGIPSHVLIATTAPNRYKCSTCNKSFPTHQALGGHRSSHNKFNIIPTLVKELAHATAQVGETGEYDHEQASSSRLQQGGSSHQLRKVRNKLTLLAPGCHLNAHEAPSSQVASSGEASHTGRRIQAFDLNELPFMEDEEGVESALAQPQHSVG